MMFSSALRNYFLAVAAVVLSLAVFSRANTNTSAAIQQATENVNSSQQLLADLDKFLRLWIDQYQHYYAQHGNHTVGAPDFQCPHFEESANAPTSVHALRPSDIKVVGALGDSLTAALGAGAKNLQEAKLEYRGLSFSMGGDGDLKFMTTLPNILKQFNSFVVGASRRVSPVWFEFYSQMNVAVSGSTAADLRDQAKELVRRVYRSKDVDFQNDWKLVTIFIGSIDLCHYCKQPLGLRSENYAKYVREAIDILYNNLPRTLVSVVSNEHVNDLRRTHSLTPVCSAIHEVVCPCVTDKYFPNEDFDAIVKEYQDATRALEGTFDERDDFTVVVQPFLERMTVPNQLGSDKPNLAFLAPDCFHWSQLGHAVTAKGLWNNMLEPVGSKATTIDVDDVLRLQCPPQDCPFIRTTKNSANCDDYLNMTTTTSTTTTEAAVTGGGGGGEATAAAPRNEPVQARAEGLRRPAQGGSIGVTMLGLLLLMLGVVAVSGVTYHGWNLAKERRDRRRMASEKTPLLGHDPEIDVVQVY